MFKFELFKFEVVYNQKLFKLRSVEIQRKLMFVSLQILEVGKSGKLFTFGFWLRLLNDHILYVLIFLEYSNFGF